MKIVTWNVNGLRACIKNGFVDSFKKLNPDIICMQETKLQQEQIPTDFFDKKKYKDYWHFAEKKGYSGTCILTKKEPINDTTGINSAIHDVEGRCITLEFDDFYLVNAYVPNAQPELKRLDYRMNYEDNLRKYLKKLDKKKPVIYCGDLNVAHEEIDLKNPKTNVENPGFSDEEREKMTDLLDSGFADVYRRLYPTGTEYTWWSYRMNAREKNVGWRIDYFIVSERFLKQIKDIKIHNEIFGSDHCPVELILK